ncbi:hypothetical protein C7H19_08670 [Aphanothece hegewaldii CCALA 016]|uniref:Uncharacterized protein n=1 Tax=Aphanothece hegewaldii CCALA 016 TaxID=2107694 RepID=A0A2T1LZ16_9CHRO|nr:hypothetical protein [Aphanothece hegewaldii]PSF37618.1 hypothetical protein C7H19_08670 [Aphanothece hegewaldii CCALA 016]
MLVILADEQILSTQQVCQGCLLATHQGLPRWYQGKLRCGRMLEEAKQFLPQNSQPTLYECKMGFRVANID